MGIENFFEAKILRRDFLKKGCFFLGLLGVSSLLTKKAWGKLMTPFLREAMFYNRLDNNTVQCGICFRRCILKEGQRSFCRNKENIGGRLYNLIHSRPSSIQIDPIEKEPALHMLPGTKILCFGTAGCNFRCIFCHNWQLSQRAIEDMRSYDVSPEEAVNKAIEEGIPTLSFTYNDPISFYEYVYDIAKLAKEKNLKILWHSNGTLNPEPLRELLKYTDAVTLDLKAFTEELYKKNSSAKLEPVLKALKIIKESGTWLEIVNLHIPTLNDNPRDVKKMCLWIKENLGKDTPLHFSRFYPAYQLKMLPLTPLETLDQAHKIAKDAGLEYVTIGNVPGHKYNSTFCPECGKRLIHRIHFMVFSNNVKNGRCKFCEYQIPGIWS